MTVVGHCGVCSHILLDLNRHTHHKIPTALGGKDTPENRIDICSECHGIIHNVALKMLNKKFSGTSILDSIKMIYKDNTKAIKACVELAKRVRDEMIITRERGLDPDTLVELSTTVRRKHKDIVRFYCKDRDISMEDYIRGLVIKDLLHRYGVNPLQEKQVIKMLGKSQPRK